MDIATVVLTCRYYFPLAIASVTHSLIHPLAMNQTNGTASPLSVVLEYMNSLNRNYTSLPAEERVAMGFVRRVQSYNWTLELVFVGIVLFMIGLYKYGTSANVSRANKLFDSVHAFLRDELSFSRVGFTVPGSKDIIYMDQHLHTWMTSFATGRSCIDCINVNLHLFPRNNPLSMFLENVVGWYFPILAFDIDNEFCEVIVRPNGVYVASEAANVNSNAKELLTGSFKFIASIVNKRVMNQSRHDNYYLALTHTTDSDEIPEEYVYMCEMNQLSGFFGAYSKQGALNELLKQASDFLDFISFTDLPGEKPENVSVWNATRLQRCVIRTKVPTSKRDLDLLNRIIALVVEIYDNYTRVLVQKSEPAFITADMLKKTGNLRTIEQEKIAKAAREAALAAEKENQKDIEREKRRNLKKSGELEKLDKKMKEKRERRQRNKQKVRM